EEPNGAFAVVREHRRGSAKPQGGGRQMRACVSPRTKCGEASWSDTLVAAHGRIDRARPLIEAAGQVLHVLEAPLAQVVGDRRAPDALMAVDDDLAPRIQLVVYCHQ